MGNSLSAAEVNWALKGLVHAYNVSFQLWPEYNCENGERRQIGTEVELLGSHTSDPAHLNPSCCQCHHVRAALALLAKHAVSVADQKRSLLCHIAYPSSIVYTSRFPP